jgi:transketolase
MTIFCVSVLMGDGEINEGSVWEAALCAGKHKLANLTALIDYNKIQSAGFTREIQDLEPLVDKWRAFGFGTAEVDGHDVSALRSVFRRIPLQLDRPSAIICHTVKGNDPNWHHKNKFADGELAHVCLFAVDRHPRDLPEHGLRASPREWAGSA